MVYEMSHRDVHERPIGKDPRDLAPERGIDAVVVAHVQKPAAQEILAQTRDLDLAQADVAVTGDMEKGKIPELVIGEPQTHFGFLDLERGSLADRGEQVRNAGR